MSLTNNFKRAIDQGQLPYVTRTSPLRPRVKVGNKSDPKSGRMKDVVAPLYQATVSGVTRSYYTISLSPAPSTSFFTASNTYQFSLIAGTISDQVKSCRLNLQYNATGGNVTIAPPPMHFNRIELYSGQNKLMNTIYPVGILILWNLFLSRWEFEQLAANVGLMNNWSPNTSALTINSGNYWNSSLPLVGTIFDATQMHWEKVTDTILMKYYSQNAVSSGAGTLNLTSSSLAFDCNIDDDIYRKDVDRLYDNNIVKTTYLDCVNISQTITLTAGQMSKISLQNLQYKIPFLCFTIRATTNNTNNNNMNFQSLSSNSTTQYTDSTLFNIQVQDSSNQDQTNRGSGLGPLDISMINGLYTDNTLFSSQNVYFIPFCKSLKKCLMGSQEDGYGLYFDGSLWSLALTPSNTFPTGTFTVDIFAFYYRSLCISEGSLYVDDC